MAAEPRLRPGAARGAGLVLCTVAVAHGLSDAAAGFLLAQAAHAASAPWVAALLVYNALAFATQPLLALLLDRMGRPWRWLLGGLALSAVALLWRPAPWLLVAALAGAGSALQHLAGGVLALRATPAQARGPGLFAALGVVGLGLGSAWGAGLAPPRLWLMGAPALSVMVGVLAFWPQRPRRTRSAALLSRSDLVILLTLALALRSALWSSLEQAHTGHETLWSLAVLAAGAGKALGGLAADRIGWTRWAMIATAGAAALPVVSVEGSAAWLLSIALLQSLTPLGLAGLGVLLPRQPALASALALGAAVALGGLTVIAGYGAVLYIPVVFAAAMLLAGAGVTYSLQKSANAISNQAPSCDKICP